MVVISKKYNWRTGVSIPVPLECESSALPFELDPLKLEEIYINYSRHHHCFYLELGYLVYKTSLFFRHAHVRMAERSKAPDSRVELFLTGVFWSTNVGVGSNPTSDKCFQISKNKRLFRAISAEKSERFVALISKIAYCSVSIVKWTSS